MTDLVLANLVVGFAGLVQATTGIGFAMIAVPLLLLIDLSYAPGPSLFVMLFLSAAMVAGARGDIDRDGFLTLFPGLFVGTVAGALLLGTLAPAYFGLAFGSMILFAILIGLLGFAPRRSPLTTAAGGFVAGAMGTISGIHGPPLVVLYQRAEPAVARATIALVFVIASLLSLASLHAEDLFGTAEVITGLSLLPGLVAGFVLSRISRGFISATVARNMMLAIAAASSIILIAKSFI